ncbi:histidine ammonia-lyase [Striga asiatica]|uniref:Histidine ammonia-lyase n=1 Tax=Striga asiatica TaxID=4170 RepID=A0A5A7QFC2_STRAF|nr:histidine ammonia-lyase [Striga asiatica]
MEHIKIGKAIVQRGQATDSGFVISIVFHEDFRDLSQWQCQETQQNVEKIALGLCKEDLILIRNNIIRKKETLSRNLRHWPQCSCFTHFFGDGPKRPLVRAEVEVRDAFKMLRAYSTDKNKIK